MKPIELTDHYSQTESDNTVADIIVTMLHEYLLALPTQKVLEAVIVIINQHYVALVAQCTTDVAFYIAIDDGIQSYIQNKQLEKKSEKWQSFQQLRKSGYSEQEAVQLVSKWHRAPQSTAEMRAAQLFEDEMKEFNADLSTGHITTEEYQTAAQQAQQFAEGSVSPLEYQQWKKQFLATVYQLQSKETL